MNDDDDLLHSLSLSKQCRKYRKYQCPTMEIPQFRPVRRMTRVFPYTHTQRRNIGCETWETTNTSLLMTEKRVFRCEWWNSPYLIIIYYEEGERRVERKKNSPRAARIYIYTRKTCWENRPQNHSKKTSSHWATRPPSTRGGRASRGGKEKGEKEGVSLGTTAEFIPQKRGAGRAARSAARGRNRENSTLTAG